MNGVARSVKRTVRDNIKTAYSLHDMNVLAFEISGNDAIMRTQSGMVKATPLYGQVDGFVEFYGLDWDFCFVYLIIFSTLCARVLKIYNLVTHYAFKALIIQTVSKTKLISKKRTRLGKCRPCRMP